MDGQTICDVKIIMSTIAFLFQKYNIPIYTKINSYLQPPYFDKLSKKLALELNLNKEIIFEKLSNIKWAVAESQIECGYLSIVKNAFDSKNYSDVPSESLNIRLEFDHLYFIHHYFMAIECLYRIWERLTKLLDYIIFGNINSKRIYFVNILKSIRDLKTLSSSKKFESLNKLNKIWNLIANKRNNASHKSSNLAEDYILEIEPSLIYDMYENPILKVKEILPDINEKIDYIINTLKKSNDAIKIVIEFILSIK